MPRQTTRLLAAASLAVLAAFQAPAARANGVAGPYLAAVQADIQNDYRAAAEYYQEAMLYAPAKPELRQSALVMAICADDVPAAIRLADSVLSDDGASQIAGLVQLTARLTDEDFTAAAALIDNPDFRFNPLLVGLMRGWIELGLGSSAKAVAAFDGMDGNDALKIYGQYHKALALAVAGDFDAAATIMAGADGTPLHLSRSAILAHAEILMQLDRRDDALAVLDGALADAGADSGMRKMRDAIAAGDDVPYTLVTSAREGAAEAMLLMGSALSRDAADRSGLVYGRLAAHIRPGFDEAILLSAEILEAQDQHALAIESYGRIGVGSDWYVTAETGRAEALRESGRVDAGIEALKSLARARPEDMSVHLALGDALRAAERYAEATDAYSAAIDLIETPSASQWGLYYSRGITYERTDHWPKAEADFRKALELQPDQPFVLNYLGYTMVEKQEKLDEAQQMIEKAVAERPDDGYITDSLGWVLYRLGKFEEAVPHIERAVELLPVDPIINDHLGDVLWAVGRKREAEFQWRRALSFGPDEADAVRIRRKLEVGLDVVLQDERHAAGSSATTPVAVDTGRDG